MSWLRKPPFGVRRWKWYVDPRLDHVKVRLSWWRQNCCGVRKPHHKMQCSAGRRR